MGAPDSARPTRTPFADVRAWFAMGLLVSLPACCRDCGCVSGEKTYESIDGKVKVELVRSVHWTGNHLVAGPVSSFSLRIHTSPSFDVALSCSHVDMAENEAGTLVGYRCKDDKEWNLIRLRGGARHVHECGAPVGIGQKPDFDRVPPLRDSVDRVLECKSDWVELVRSLGEDDGPTAAAELVVRLAERESPSFEDSWDRAFDALDANAQGRVLEGICGKVAEPGASNLSYMRAAARCPVDRPEVTTAALQRFREAMKPGREWGPAEHQAAQLAIHGNASEAGAIGCEALPASTDSKASGYAYAAIALGRTRCPVITTWLKARMCSSQYDCGDKLCTEQELRRELDDWLKTVVVQGRSGKASELPSSSRLYLTALIAQGPLPQDFLLQNARRHYEVPDAGPGCEEPQSAGNPCLCTSLLQDSNDLCQVPASQKQANVKTCAFRINDGKRCIEDVRSYCVTQGNDVVYGQACCPGLDKELKPEGGFRCVQSGDESIVGVHRGGAASPSSGAVP